jgi:hypothetical protein
MDESNAADQPQLTNAPDPMRSGYTVAAYFPPEADWEMVQFFLDRLSVLADGYFTDRKGWDPFVFGQRGDVLHVDCEGHVYLSTSCFHDEHEYCQSSQGVNESGEKWKKYPNRCKFCDSVCICPCHVGAAREDEEETKNEEPHPQPSDRIPGSPVGRSAEQAA